MRLSNCNAHAWRAYSSGASVWMACRKSPYSKMTGRMPLAIRLIGTGLLWGSTVLWVLGHYLRFGTWAHWVFCEDLVGDCREGVPSRRDRSQHWIPPFLYESVERRYRGFRKQR